MGTLSTVGVTSIPDAEDANSLAVQVETDSIVADAKSVLRRVDALKPFYIARTGSGETLHGLF